MKLGHPWIIRVRPWLWSATKWMAVLMVIAAGFYWFRFAPIPVETHPVQKGTLVVEVMGTGTLEARVSTTISPKISGRIARVLYDQGDAVKKGTSLVRLDDEELKQQVAIAEANVEAANAAIVRLEADKERSTVVFEQAQRHHHRIEQLAERSATTPEEFEKAVEALAVAVADVGRAEAAITEGRKGFITAEKTLQYHRARLDDTRIVAPFDGLIVARQREAGDVVVPGSAILTLIATDVLWIKAWVDETEMSQLAEGQAARVVFRSDAPVTYPGQVVRLGREADRETREFVVDVEVLELPRNWAVGQRAEVYIEIDRKENVTRIPSHLLVRTRDGDGVFLHAKGYARQQPVTVGLRSREAVEVVEGLATSDVVISAKPNAEPLVEGRRVLLP